MADNGSTIAQAYVQIIPSTEGIGKGIEQAMGDAGEQSGKTFGGKFTSTAGGVLKATGKAMAVTAGATVGLGGALYGLATKSADTADRIDKMSQKLGISRKSFQELDYVLSQSGASIDSFGAGSKTLLANMDKVASGSDETRKKFEALGVSVTDSSGKMRNQEDVLYDTISAFQKMEDGAEKNRLAQELFGKSGQELLPLLNSEAGSFEELTQKANDLGLVMGDDLIDSGVKLTDSLDTTKRTIGALMTQIAAKAMPIVQKALDFIIDNLPKIQGFIDKMAPVVMDALDKIAPVLADVGEKLIPVIAEAIAEILPIVLELLAVVLPVVAEIIEIILPKLIAVIEIARDSIVQLKDNFVEAWEKIKGAWEKASGFFSGVWEKIKSIFSGVKEFFRSVFATAYNTIETIFKPITNFFSGIWSGIKNVFNRVGEVVGKAIKSTVERAVNGVLKTAVGIINGFIGAINGAISVINAIPGVKISKLDKLPVPQMERGGILEKGEIGLLEGKGAEAVVPLDQNEKWIKAVADDMRNAIGSNDNRDVLEEIRDGLSALKNLTVVMDTGATVGALVSPMDNALGRLASRRERFA